MRSEGRRRTPSRRQFLSGSAGLAGLAGLAAFAETRFEPGAAETATGVLVNHLGFTPWAPKSCLYAATRPLEFKVLRADTGRQVLRGRLAPVRGDLGDYAVGDFSALKQPGRYRIAAGNSTSEPFEIDPTLYADPLRNCVAYFSVQRCGDSRTGYNAPCHLDDGRRTDNGRRHDATGGWHDACDVRKWVNATLYGMTGLSSLLDLRPAGPDPARVLDELTWGNAYFLKMQEPAGYVMDYCGGDDGNWFTDNRPGSSDDRQVQTRVCELPAQFHFAAAQACMVRHLRGNDSDAAAACARAARLCFRWCVGGRRNHTSTSLGAAVLACGELHRAFGEQPFEAAAADFARQLLALQADAPVPGLFLRSQAVREPAREIMHGNLPLLALCALLERFPRHADAGTWRRALGLHVEYLVAMAGRSAFGTVPFGVYYHADPGGGRRVGPHWYRWFMRPNGENPSSPDWWVGVNAHLASNGIGLARAARLINDPRLRTLAQRQLDWIIGVNPFNASTITAVGSNQPRLFTTGEFKPVTPPIPGGVMNGLGGNENDIPVLAPGSYHTCEYWTPMVAYTTVLMAELAGK